MTQDAFSELLALGTGPELIINEKETFIDAFLRQVEKTPDATAVVDEFGAVTYGELNRRSDSLASVLIEKGIQVGDFVAVKLPRVKEFLVAVIGIWKAGSAYIPIDPEYPEDRIKYMLEDSGAKVVIDHTWLERLREACTKEHSENICRAEAEGTALLMYTSGSTGVPKGVVIPHAAILGMSMSGNIFHRPWAGEGYKLADISSFSYIYSCQNMYMPLIGGWELHLLPTRMTSDIACLDRYLREHNVNIVNTVPQMAVTLVNSYHTPLDIIGVGGSKMVMPDNGMARVLVGYGLTETSGGVIYMMVSEKDNGKSIIGRPSAGTVVVLEDEDGAPVPFGEVGEICISSRGLASGYLHDEAKTREVFVDRPWSKYKVLRTGDLGRWNEDKVLEFRGRKDDMVKLRGNRVELGEVDASLSRIAGIKAAASALKDINGESILCGYYVSEETLPETLLRSSLSEFLPSYMIPSLFVRLEAIPHLPNGKLDRLSLPIPEITVWEDIVAPQTEFEKQVFKIVSEEIGIQDFGVTTNLLSLGLTSLRAIHLSVTLKRKLGLHIPQSVILAHPTIREWESVGAGESDTIAIEAPREHYPLAENQMGVYIECERGRQSDRYNNPFLLKISGGDVDKLLDSVRKTIEIHPVLKTHLSERDGRIVLLRRDNAVLDVGCEKLDFEPDEEFFRNLVRPFNLLEDDLARFTVYSSPNAAWLFFDIHHIIFDGSSVNLFLKTLSLLYRDISPEAESVTAYDYALYLERWKETDEFRECDRYFETLLEGTEPFSYPSMSIGKAEEGLGTEVLTLPRENVKSFCRKCRITENSFFATVLTQVLHRFSREENIQIAMFSSGRSMAQLAGSIGMFVQTLPLVSRTAEDTVFDALKSMHSQIVETLSRDKYPYTVLAEKYGVKPSVMYVYQGDLVEEYDFGAVSTECNRLPLSCAISPLSVEIVPDEDEYIVRFEYQSSLYDTEEIRTLAKAFANMVCGMAESKAATPLRTIETVDAQERQELLSLGTGERIDYDRSETLVDMFLRSVSQYPDSTAVVDYRSSLTYRELDELSDAIAHRLLEKGVKPDDFVVVELPRVKEFVAAVIGIWKAGAAYVPIDPTYPEKRIKYMLEDSETKVVIDEAFCNGITPEGCSPVNRATPDGLAYMIYTSGSSGSPKGVMIQHKAYFNFVSFYIRQQALTASDRMGCHRNFCFDASLNELFPILCRGGQLHLMSDEIRKDFSEIYKFIIDRQLTCATFTTSVGEMLIQEYPDIPLRFMEVGGERLNYIPNLKTSLWNFYGPTECAVDCTAYLVDKEREYKNVPIGRPVDNMTILLCDKTGHLVPKGDAGEICVVGPQLAKGYWKQPELTAEKFVPCTYLPGQRMYKTGDLARWNEEGELEFLGRIDDQVKIRGFRVELGEIERSAMQVEGTSLAAAKVKNDSIILYWCGESSEADIRSHLSGQLPAYMQPSAYMHLEAMPLNPNGKIDRKKLPDVEMTASGETVAPRTLQEQELTDLICETIALGNFGITTNLISVGLTSISAMRIAAKVSHKYGVQIRMVEFMSNPTVEGLASLLNAGSCKESHFGKVHPVQEYYPLTANQLGVYIDWENNKNGIQYNTPYALKFKNVDAETLRAAVESVVSAHPVLNMRLAIVDGAVMQHRNADLTPEVTVSDLPEGEMQSFFQSWVRPFDLFSENLYRFEIYRSGDDCYLLKDIHHIITDGLSEGMLYEEIGAAVNGESVLQETYTFFDYSIESEEYKHTDEYRNDSEYFKNLLCGLEATSYPESFKTTGFGKCRDAASHVCTVSIVINKGTIDKKCYEQGVTVSNYILYSVMQVLRSITREEKVLIGAVSNGRGHDRQHDCQGFFVKTLPVISAESAKELQREMLESISHEEYPLTDMVERFGIRPQILYAYQGDVGENRSSSDIEVIPLSLDTPKFPLSITVEPEGAESYVMSAEYDGSKYSEGDIKNLLNCISNMAVTGRLLSENEEQSLISLGTGEKFEYDHSETFVDMFLRSVAQYPDATAVVDSKSSYTYRELDTLSDAIALRLIDKWVKPNDFVAVMLPRVKEFVAAVIGIWKAGAAYVPIDPTYPKERIDYMLEDSEAKVVIDEAFCKSITTVDCQFINLSTSDGLAYMIYTSGSTGNPKGVLLGHRGLVNYIHSTAQINGLRRGDRISAHRSFSFDAHIEEFYPTLFAGGAVYIMPEEIRKDLDLIYKFIVENKIDGCYFTTSMAVLLYQNYDLPVRFIGAAGEKLLGVVGGKNGVIFLNSYGPTECTDHISAFQLESGRTYPNVPIGRPLHNGTVLIMDACDRLVPCGMTGELCFASPQLAKGYWKQPELTAEKFVSCPYLSGQRMYKTGDLARWNEEGELEYLGRIDNQVKIRGFRVELGEIERSAMLVEGTSQVAVKVKGDNIVLYWCGHSSEADIRIYLSEQLPAYMQPSAYMHLDAMPLSASGKIDRKKLPVVEMMENGEIVVPRTQREQELMDLIHETVALSSFGVTTNLISVGMTSIAAMRIAAKVNHKYEARVGITEFMSNPTVEGLASLLNAGSGKKPLFGNVHPAQEYYPLTHNQRLVYLSYLRNKDTIQYNMPSAWYIPVEDIDKTRDALASVVDSHPHLKTHLVMKDGDIMQQRRDECAVNITVVDTDSELTKEYIQSRIQPFNLEKDLYRVEIHRTSQNPQCACVILDIHHIISDGLSMQVFRQDLRKTLAGEKLNPEQYSAYDFAIDLQESVNSAEYQTAEKWFDSMISGKEVTVYPHSYEGLKNPYLASIESEIVGSDIDVFCKKYGFTPSNYFLTAFLYLLHEVTRENELVITSISNGRHSSSMMDTIGMFVTTLPVSAGMVLWAESVKNAIGAVQRQMFQNQDYDFYPFSEMVERHGIHAEIMYEYQGGITDCNDGMNAIDLSLDVAKLPLMLSVDHGGAEGNYRLLVRYDQSMYSKVDMERMLGMLSFIAERMPSAPCMSSIDLLDDAGVKEIMKLSTGPCLDVDIDVTFVKAFRKCAYSYPDNLAIEDESGTRSYAQLDNSSDVLAHVLVDAGVTPDSCVALLLDRTWFFPLSVIAVHKAGAAYLPLDLEYPLERMKFMLDDSQTKVLLTTRKDFETFCKDAAVSILERTKVIYIDDLDLSAKSIPLDVSRPEGNAYLAYTSGSTGKPKGVIIHQAGLWNFICGIRSIYGHTADDRIACHRTFSFAAHVEDIFAILTVGGSLHIMPSGIRKDLDLVCDYLASHRITGCGFISSVTMLLLKNYKLNLRYITGGGENFFGVICTGCPQIIQSYGPTECTAHTSVFPLEKGKIYDRIPVGKPLPNNWMFVLSADGKLLPRGVAGELCFAGIQVAKGYLNNPELSSEKFCDCPFVEKDHWNRPVRMYHTGDLVRWNEDGHLEHIGRIDNQFKLRGFRIEPGEIENVALHNDGVLSAVAAVKNETLVLYYTAESDVEFHWDTLPDYMIPSVYMHLDAMPLNNNGKIDRKKLPEPEIPHSEKVAPATEREQIVFDKVKELLGTDSFGVTDDLTRFGMDSIRAMKLALELPSEWGINVSDIVGSRSIREYLNEKHNVVWFKKDYDPSKKTVVVVHGLIGDAELTEIEDRLSETYNVLKIEHIYATLLSQDNIDKLVSFDGYNEFIRLYNRRIKEVMPEGCIISLFIGFSLGGWMAYDVACEWSCLTEQKPVVVMGDSYLILSSKNADNEQLVENLLDHVPSPGQWRERIREIYNNPNAVNGVEYKNELLHTIRGNKKTIQHYDGKVIMLRAVHGHKLNVDVKSRLKSGIIYNVVRWLYWHLHIRDIVLGEKTSKMRILEPGHKRQSQDNISEWRKYASDMEVIDVDSTHNGLFWDKALIPMYLELIKSSISDTH